MKRHRIHEFIYGFAVTAQPNKSNFKLEYSSPIQSETITGIQIRRRKAGAKSINGNDLVNDDVFGSALLTLKQRNAEVFEKIPLELIALATEQGLWYEVCLPNIDMAQSEILVTNIAALVANEDFEIIIRYENKIQ